MAFAMTSFTLHLLTSFLLLPSIARGRCSFYSAIFSFGDSLTDTGNVYHLLAKPRPQQPPHGMTYFRRPSGRFSDGRLVIDFIAQAMKLPLVPPYFASNSSKDFKHGANFAVSGACALSTAFMRDAGFSNARWKDKTLSTQLKWFEQLLQQLPPNATEDILSKSLFLVGEMGVNDYSFMSSDEGATIDGVRPYVPDVVTAIGSTVDALIQTGAKTVLVAGMYPMGCMPVFLTQFYSQRAEEFDPKTGCNNKVNEFARHHNLLLQQQLARLRQTHPQSKIIYADYYGAMMPIYQYPQKFGIQVPLNACCGGQGPYNFSFYVGCGAPTSKLCSDPSNYISWDGVHLTEAAHRVIARHILQRLPVLQF